MTDDLIERLRTTHGEVSGLMHEAADALAQCREQRDKWCKAYEGCANENASLRAEVERLKAIAKENYTAYENELASLRAEVERLRGALEKIASLEYVVETEVLIIARAALGDGE